MQGHSVCRHVYQSRSAISISNLSRVSASSVLINDPGCRITALDYPYDEEAGGRRRGRAATRMATRILDTLTVP